MHQQNALNLILVISENIKSAAAAAAAAAATTDDGRYAKCQSDAEKKKGELIFVRKICLTLSRDRKKRYA